MPDYRALAVQAARKWGIPVQPFLRQLNQESGFRPGLTSPAGARWIGQFIPSTARAYGVHDDVSSIFGAAHYMADNLKRYGTMQRALSAYNSGRPDAYLDPNFAKGQTYRYVRSIMGGDSIPVHSPGQGHGNVVTGNVNVDQPAHQQAPAENTHAYSDFAMNLIAATQNHSPEAMLGAIMNLRKSLDKPQPVSQPTGAVVKGPSGGGGPGGKPTYGNNSPLNEMMRAEQMAKSMGLRASENYNEPGGVHPVHVKTSYHYRKYPGSNVGRAIDVTGSPQQMMAFAKKMLALGGTSELFYDPFGGYKYGKSIGPIGGHGTHVHVAY